MPDEQLLCLLRDIPDGGARGLLREGRDDRVFAVRQGEEVFVWLNDCPHNHRPLDYRQDMFLSGDGQHIVCFAHSAHFDIRAGHCFAGPCVGLHLTPVPARVAADGGVWIPRQLPAAPAPQRRAARQS
ncbi:Rieske (2Fe-2S) protein [Pseudomonas citronellolis]|uniref:Rieske (2Fe-2S) protein n=1 Tax=Pseudomonas citronellolis TaxID=53408 RepID=UPI0021BE81FC|nr:Rieske 2Fe-2S domain-containing protein [Pseudomonas citronellolis]UXJ50498.1 Rieske 2Fe-2S domain-containing protein [Pseudomonas citronellolis]